MRPGRRTVSRRPHCCSSQTASVDQLAEFLWRTHWYSPKSFAHKRLRIQGILSDLQLRRIVARALGEQIDEHLLHSIAGAHLQARHLHDEDLIIAGRRGDASEQALGRPLSNAKLLLEDVACIGRPCRRICLARARNPVAEYRSVKALRDAIHKRSCKCEDVLLARLLVKEGVATELPRATQVNDGPLPAHGRRRLATDRARGDEPRA
mmetsp:Transcript_27013/g.77724  ORF Transcript_27013/g.77724 Transcript_27013/m.77724 type:complete len:208 (-) Transcript_27013:24-647(-)